MKKIFIFIICLISFSPTAKAFLGEDLGTNLYDNIDEGFEEMELKQYEYEVSGQGEGVQINFNKILKAKGLGECISKDITIKEIEKIVYGEIGILYSYVSEDCKNEDKSISNDQLTNIQNTIKEIYEISKSRAAEKTKQINNISRIGIYSDGNIKNSPFDLVSDLEDIDKIIFSSEIVYEGEDYTNNDNLLEKLLTGESKSNNGNQTGNGTGGDGTGGNGTGGNGTGGNGTGGNGTGGNGTGGNGTGGNGTGGGGTGGGGTGLDEKPCVSNSESTGLSISALNNILNDIKKSNINNGNNNQTGNSKTTGNNNGAEGNGSNKNTDKNSNGLTSTGSENNTGENSDGTYKSVNDNAMWPCENFFCITIEFITYNHKLLGGGENISIEYLMNRSNEHLKKFAATSLMPSTMTVNNFELGFKDIKLSDMFHMGFIIQSKPIPILEIKKEGKKEKGEFTNTNILEQYYKNIGLEYKRKNDIHKFKAKEEEIKTLIDSAELSSSDVVEKLGNLQQNKSKDENKNSFVEKNILKKVGNDELSDFEDQFLELRKFSSSINEYVTGINGIIKKMNKIPIKK